MKFKERKINCLKERPLKGVYLPPGNQLFTFVVYPLKATGKMQKQRKGRKAKVKKSDQKDDVIANFNGQLM